MAFKLGSEKGLQAEGGNIRSKLRFKKEDASVPGTPVFRKSLGDGILGEANMDGSISVDPSVKPNSPLYKRVMKHEMQHVNDMESGRAAYGDNWVMWEDKIYIRKEVDGITIIDGPNGRWPEGDENHPWEQEAIEAENE